jgi:hypothetical protein
VEWRAADLATGVQRLAREVRSRSAAAGAFHQRSDGKRGTEPALTGRHCAALRVSRPSGRFSFVWGARALGLEPVNSFSPVFTGTARRIVLLEALTLQSSVLG